MKNMNFNISNVASASQPLYRLVSSPADTSEGQAKTKAFSGYKGFLTATGLLGLSDEQTKAIHLNLIRDGIAYLHHIEISDEAAVHFGW